MKINSAELNKFIKDIPNNVKSVLIYGGDNGLVYDRSKAIINNLKLKHPNIDVAKFIYDDIKTGKLDLESSTKNLSFFSSYQIFVIEDIPTKMEKSLENLIQNMQDGYFIIFLAKELTPANGFRKFFESSKNAAIIPCYKDDAKTIRMIASAIFKENKKTCKEEVLDYIQQHLKGDRKNIINELNKIILYVGAEEEVTLEDITSCASFSIESSFEYLNHAIADRNAKEAIFYFYDLVDKGNSPIALMRGVLNYFLRLYQAKTHIQKGINARQAMQTLVPPVFIMNVNIFLTHLNKFSYEELENILSGLFKLEEMSKKTGASIKQLSERLIVVITDSKKEFFF